MIEELREIVERALQQPEDVQRRIADLIRQELEQTQAERSLSDGPPLNYAGAWSDLQDDDEFAYFERMRHEIPPTPPI